MLIKAWTESGLKRFEHQVQQGGEWDKKRAGLYMYDADFKIEFEGI